MRRVEPEAQWSAEVWSIINTIRDQYKPDKIVIFGSHASGQPTQDSDLDVLVVKETDKRDLDRVREVSALLTPRNIPVDIFVKTPQEIEQEIADENTFVKHILGKCKVVYEDRGDQ